MARQKTLWWYVKALWLWGRLSYPGDDKNFVSRSDYRRYVRGTVGVKARTKARFLKPGMADLQWIRRLVRAEHRWFTVKAFAVAITIGVLSALG